MPSRLYEAAMSCVYSWDTGDADKIAACRSSPNTTQIVRPTVMGIPAMNTAAEVRAFFAPIAPLVKRIDIKVLDVTEDEPRRKVTVWCENTWVFHDERVQSGHSEYIMILEFDEDYKVTKCVDFIDAVSGLNNARKIRMAREFAAQAEQG